jgi:hypothetical protein
MKCRECGAEIELVPYSDEDSWTCCDDVETGVARLCNGYYGCDSWCEFVRLSLVCECGHEYVDGEFGEFETEQEYNEFLERALKRYDLQGELLKKKQGYMKWLAERLKEYEKQKGN